MKQLKPIPVFNTEAEEAAFWAVTDSTDYLDWDKAKKIRLPNLIPSS